MSFRNGSLRSLCAGAMLLVIGSPAVAQSFYPSFQQPRVVSREFNFAIADGDNVTPLVFQWREGTSPGTQLSLDLGLADPDNDALETFFMAGGQYARMLTQARPDMPLDLLLTVGLFGQFGNDITAIGVPVGVSIGHRFPLTGTSMAVTPYIHPRVSLDYASINDESDTEVNIVFDIGGNLELTPQLALRLTALFGDNNSIGLSLAWTPRGLRSSGMSR